MTRPARITLPTGSDTRWQEHAACADADVALFYEPDRGQYEPARVRRAKAVCAGCPVREACLAWAFEQGDYFAILGGLTGDERRAMRRRATRRDRAS